MPDSGDEQATLVGSVLYGFLFGVLFGMFCSAISLWNGAAKQFPVWKIVLGFGGFTLACAVASAIAAGSAWFLHTWWSRFHRR